MKVIVAGGTGFIGKILVQRLMDKGHRVVVLSRRPELFKTETNSLFSVEYWDASHAGDWVSQIDEADAVINLTGEGIAEKRWSAEQKEKLKKSRLESTRALVEAISKAVIRPKTLINASAVGFYGNVPEGEVTESSAKGKGFLSDLCAMWEEEALKARDYKLRVVLVRIGIVLEKGGGALQKMVPPFQAFAGGPLGSGKQYFPWVHRDDVVGAILFALDNPSIEGPVNATAPQVVTMAEFCRSLGKALGKPSWAPVPGFGLKLLLGEMAEMLLTGQKAVPQKLTQAGYHFKYASAEEALKAILSKH